MGSYCGHNFFGPVLSSQSLNDTWYVNQFYVSPLEPNDFSKISDLEYEQKALNSSLNNVYLMGLFDSNLVNMYQTY